MAEALVVLTTADSRELADRLAGTLVERRLAACVNIVPGLTSVYRWQGEICREPEVLLLIKTTEARLADVTSTVREVHGYEVPEVVALPAAFVQEDYLHWLTSSVASDDR